jgi:hypothetical protein
MATPKHLVRVTGVSVKELIELLVQVYKTDEYTDVIIDPVENKIIIETDNSNIKNCKEDKDTREEIPNVFDYNDNDFINVNNIIVTDELIIKLTHS